MKSLEISRRYFLSLSAQATLAGYLLKSETFAQTSQNEIDSIKNRATRILRELDAQGIHRTGTKIDNNAANWLADLVKDNGARPQSQEFKLNRIDLIEAYLQIGDKKIEGVPAFDGGFTDANGVSGTLGKFGDATEIVFGEVPPEASTYDQDEYNKFRQTFRGKAIIVVAKGRRDGLALINAPFFDKPYGAPVLQISNDNGAFLQAQLKIGAMVKVVCQIKRTLTTAKNVYAEIVGRDPKLAPICVMTPRSSWWNSTSERGGGLVCWLEVMRSLAKSKPLRSVKFIASSGHELGHLGLNTFLDQNLELVKKAYIWLHFGANIGAAQNEASRLRASSEELEKLTIAALTAAEQPLKIALPRTGVPFGEIKNIHERGGESYISMSGLNDLFHLPIDRFPDAVNIDSIARTSLAFSQLAGNLANRS